MVVGRLVEITEQIVGNVRTSEHRAVLLGPYLALARVPRSCEPLSSASHPTLLYIIALASLLSTLPPSLSLPAVMKKNLNKFLKDPNLMSLVTYCPSIAPQCSRHIIQT